MSTYYIDPISGKQTNRGTSPKEPFKTWAGLELRPGDTVLLKRGGVFYEPIESPDGAAGSPVIWDAYGEGDAPQVRGSIELKPENWERRGANIWKYNGALETEAGNLIFNRGESFGTFRWSADELTHDGDFFDSGCGKMEQYHICREANDALYLYCAEDPGRHYKKIEAALYGHRRLATATRHVIIRNISFYGSGVHGFAASDACDITIENCRFECIGGVAWNRDRKIRFGNAIEFWERCRDITIRGCTIKNIYDSCFTHQGSLPYDAPENIRFEDNVCDTYGMAAYEVRDIIPINAVFSGNICQNAGCGFAMQGEEIPRRSEIWPQPMGHHVFVWRINEPTKGGRIVFEGNTFGAAPHGSTIYSIIDPAPAKQLEFKENTIQNENIYSIYMNGGYITYSQWMK